MAGSPAQETLSWENLVYLADLFIQGGCREMRFLGGEPTLHPQFADFFPDRKLSLRLPPLALDRRPAARPSATSVA